MNIKTDQIKEDKTLYIYTVILSFVPISIIFLLYLTLKLAFNVVEFHPNSFWYTLIIMMIFISSNFVSYTTLASIIIYKIYWRSTIITNIFLLGFICHLLGVEVII